jgi:hypothetical protein
VNARLAKITRLDAHRPLHMLDAQILARDLQHRPL